MQIKRVPYFPIDSHAEIVAEMLDEALSFQHLILFVLDLLKFAVLLHLSLNHPDIHVFFLGTQPIGHSLLQFLEIVLQEVRTLLAPSQSLREIIASSQWNDGHWDALVFYPVIGHLGDHPHHGSIATANDEDGLYFFLIQEFSKSFKAFLSGCCIFQVVKVDVDTHKVLFVAGQL